ncbi:MAG: prepilin-type N-terminal cleavage/methylation domain-containing protein [Magnetococcales bacterium]|nr:prepilin-type N-terminal cleavage/methylation domain-containing protein [Magnetococcales bacterium]
MRAANGKTRRAAGFTLIEIAIVVVIIGLLLGGILKGQEMVSNARVHHLMDQGAATRAAILGFSDRFHALPGDYALATRNIPGARVNGDGNGRVGGDPDVASQDGGRARATEIAAVWEHLSKAGFLTGAYDGNPAGVAGPWSCAPGTCLVNAFNGGLVLAHDRQHYHADPGNPANYKGGIARNQLTTGPFVPVEVMAELDRKGDDGDPAHGFLLIGHAYLATPEGGPRQCAAAAPGARMVEYWNLLSRNSDCGGVYLF